MFCYTTKDQRLTDTLLHYFTSPKSHFQICFPEFPYAPRQLPYDPALPLLGIYPKNMRILTGKDPCTPMFIATLYTIAKTGKQPRCPRRDKWIKKMWYLYTMDCYSAIRNDEIQPFVKTWMDLEGIMLSEISQREKVRFHMISLISRR